MYPLAYVLLLVLASINQSLAQSTNASSAAAAAEIALLPSCALLCLETAIETSSCTATNQTCICLDEILLTNVTVCVTETCTIIESLSTKNTTNTFCGVPPRDATAGSKAVILTFYVVAGIVVLFRLISRPFTNATFGMDDILTSVLFVIGTAALILTFQGTFVNGLGKDIWTLTPDQVTNFLREFYFMELIYFAEVPLLKLTLLFFYMRIFPGPGIRRLIWVTIIFNILFGIAFVVAAIFQCTPINYFWESWDGQHTGFCVDINDLGWANAAISIAVDLFMLALPMSQLIHLRLHWKKKVGVAAMFCVGTFVTVISILRLQSLIQFASSTNPTWDNLGVNQWSFLEISIGMLCACMPSIRVLLVRMFPTIFGSGARSTLNSNARYYADNTNHSQRLGNISIAGKSAVATDREVNDSDGMGSAGINRKTTVTVEFARKGNDLVEGDEAFLMEELRANENAQPPLTPWPRMKKSVEM